MMTISAAGVNGNRDGNLGRDLISACFLAENAVKIVFSALHQKAISRKFEPDAASAAAHSAQGQAKPSWPRKPTNR
jgi:hypothetical protein